LCSLHPFSLFYIVIFYDLVALVDGFPVPHPFPLFIGQSVRLARKSAPFGRNPWRLFAIAHFFLLYLESQPRQSEVQQRGGEPVDAHFQIALGNVWHHGAQVETD
jgi:hypothetical protein